ncbi:MAG: hypothetical protein PHC61_11030 [Chitinivibrionales bacterium]|nr:hypothetical protein [Chitinivibrionales bacterium]
MAIKPKLIVPLLLLLVFFQAGAKAPSADTAYAVLQSVKMPSQLITGVLPRSYRASVTLAGSLAAEMETACKQLELEAPQYEESFDNGKFTLRLANGAYPEQTRDLLGGIINPITMIDLLLAGVVKFKEPARFNLLMTETALQKNYAIVKNRSVATVHLRPRANRFGYACEDLGGRLVESWLSALDCTIDTAAHLVMELDLRKHVRVRGEAPAPDSVPGVDYGYRFEYETINGHVLPAALYVTVNDTPTLSVKARYRRENKAVVFDQKEIYCRNRDGSPAAIHMRYGVYRFTSGKETATATASPKYAGRLLNAARLARSAGAALSDGHIEAALDFLHQLTTEYKGTPQAVEGEKLLQGLGGPARWSPTALRP